MRSGVLDTSFSDHQAIFCIRGSPPRLPSQPLVKNVRSLKNYSEVALCRELCNVSWAEVLLAPNVDIALDLFCRIFHCIIDKVAPFRRI